MMALLRGLIAAAIIAQEICRPIVAPVLRLSARLALMQRLSAWVAGLARFGVLAVLGAAFVVVEPLKILALWLLAAGQPLAGAAMFVASHGLSLLLVERILHAGLPQLRSFGWFERVYGLVVVVRTRLARLPPVRRARVVGWRTRRWLRRVLRPPRK